MILVRHKTKVNLISINGTVKHYMSENIPKFLTIRETAKTGILSEHHLRIMEKQGRLPGVRVGNRFKVNLDLLVDQLNQESTPAQREE